MATDFENFQNTINYAQPVETKHGKWKDHLSTFEKSNFLAASWAKAGFDLTTLIIALSPLALAALAPIAPFAAIGLLGAAGFAFKQASIRERAEQRREGKLGYNGKRVLKNTLRYMI